MPNYLNTVTLLLPRNGSTAHNGTDPNSSGTVLAGARFTPTAGRLLVATMGGSVTSTTPVGWTLPAGGSAVNQSGLYVWHKTAAGSDTLSTAHNGSNYPVIVTFIEYPAGSTFVGSVAGTNVAYIAGAGPVASGLVGLNDVFYVVAQNQTNNGAVSAPISWSAGTEIAEGWTGYSTTEGTAHGVAVSENYALGSASSAASVAGGSSQNTERLTFAIKMPPVINARHASDGSPNTTGTGAQYPTGAITVAEGDLPVVVFAVSGGSTTNLDDDGTVTSDIGISFVRVGTTVSALLGGSNGNYNIGLYVATSPVPAGVTSMTLSFAKTTAAAFTGYAWSVTALKGMRRYGADAVRQIAYDSNTGSDTPTFVFGANMLTTSPSLYAIAAFAGSGTNTPPTGWTEQYDGAHTGPSMLFTSGIRESGFTTATITHGTTHAGGHVSLAAEFDMSGPVVGGSFFQFI